MEDTMKTLMFDVAQGRKIYDDETNREISVAEASDKIQEFCCKTLGLSKNSSDRDIKRALKKPEAQELFAIIEEVVDDKISTGWHDNEFFNEYVETRNMADGDDQEFYTEKDVLLTVAQVSGDHHDLSTQRLGEGSSVTIPTSYYAVKVGSDIRLFLLGRRNWSEFVDAVAKAFVKKIQDTLYTEVMGAGASIPASSQFNKTGAIGTATKDTLDELIEDVSMANDNAPVVIMGTKTALKKLNALSDVNWRPEYLKENVARTGILGDYEGTALVEIPQRFANNDTATKLVDNTKLLIMPQVDNKFAKFVDYGETTLEVTEKGDTKDDMQTYELQRRMGVGVVITKYFGTWVLE